MTYVPPPVPERWGIGKWGQAHWDGDLALGATKGTITLTPRTVSLLRGYRAVTNTGSIVLSAKTVNLYKTSGATLVATVGSIVLAPKTVNFKTTRSLVAQKGAIVLTPRTVLLNEQNKL